MAVPGGTTVVRFLNPGDSFTVPADWNSANNKIECVGAGAGGDTLGGAGGGGAYSAIINLNTLTPGSGVTFTVGTGGTSGNSGGDTWFNGASLAASSVGAKGGADSGGTGGGQGGQASAGIGTTKNNGGDGGGLASGNPGGGGGAAGPNGDGAAGSNGGLTLGGAGGNADNNSGGAGGAGVASGTPNPGGNGTEFDGTHGSGGGGGGNIVGTGGAGGNYGGGGGAGTTGGAGANGLIVVTYQSIGQPALSDWPVPKAATPVISLRTWLQGVPTNITFGYLPSVNTAWFNPWGPAQGSVALKSWINQTQRQLIGKDSFPSGSSHDDIPNPRAPTPGISLRTHIFPGGFPLLGKDKFFWAGPPDYDWPNPVGHDLRSRAKPTIDLKTWIQEGGQNLLIGKDKFFGAAGQVPDYDWPNPRGPVFSNDLRTWLNPVIQTAVVAAPFSQINWPNPSLTRRELLGSVSGAALSLNASLGRPFKQVDWSNPRGPAPTYLYGWFNTTSLALNPSLGQPFNQDNWPLPIGPVFSNYLRGWIKQPLDLDTLAAVDVFRIPQTFANWRVDPNAAIRAQAEVWQNPLLATFTPSVPPAYFAQFDWPVPKAQAASLELRTWLQSPLQPQITYLPCTTSTWFNPWGATPASDLRTWLSNGFGIQYQVVAVVPPTNYDWPVPKGPKQPVADWLSPLKLNLQGQDQFFGLAGNPNHDWPVPKGQSTNDLRGWINSTSLALRAPVAAPFSQQDWQNPRTGISNDLRGWIDNTALSLNASLNQPFNQDDWANPRTASSNDLRGWVDYTSLALNPSLGQPFKQTDWPVPRSAAPASDLRTWLQGFQNSLQPVGVIPVASFDWPNPRAAQQPVDAKTWINQTQRQLIGQDKLPFVQTSWPVPNGPTPGITLKSWLNPLNPNLRDQFFGLAGAPNFSWPNPRGAPWTIDAGSVQQMPTTLLPPGPPPSTGELHNRYFFADVGSMMSR